MSYAFLRFRSVSKSWCSLISDPKFKVSTQRQQVIVRCTPKQAQHKGQWRFSTHLVDDEALVKELHSPKLTQKLYDSVPRSRGSCNGLLFVSAGQDLFLWNPLTRLSNKVLSHYLLSYYQCGAE